MNNSHKETDPYRQLQLYYVPCMLREGHYKTNMVIDLKSIYLSISEISWVSDWWLICKYTFFEKKYFYYFLFISSNII